MEIRENKNFVLGYFERFREKKNYSEFLEKLEPLTKSRLNGEILYEKGYSIPNIGPDPALENFSENLPDPEWSSEERENFRKICKIFIGNPIETDDECLLMIEISKDKDLCFLKNYIRKKSSLELESLPKLFSKHDPIINSILMYVVESLE